MEKQKGKKTRRGKKKKLQCNIQKEKRGYKERTIYSTSKFMYNRNANDKWLKKHILNLQDSTEEGVKLLLDSILRKPVGIDVPHFHVDLCSVLNNHLKDLLANHKKFSKKYVYKLLRIVKESYLNASNTNLSNKRKRKCDDQNSVYSSENVVNQDEIANAENYGKEDVFENSLRRLGNIENMSRKKLKLQSVNTAELSQCDSPELLIQQANSSELLITKPQIEQPCSYKSLSREGCSTEFDTVDLTEESRRSDSSESSSSDSSELLIEQPHSSEFLLSISPNEQPCSSKSLSRQGCSTDIETVSVLPKEQPCSSKSLSRQGCSTDIETVSVSPNEQPCSSKSLSRQGCSTDIETVDLTVDTDSHATEESSQSDSSEILIEQCKSYEFIMTKLAVEQLCSSKSPSQQGCSTVFGTVDLTAVTEESRQSDSSEILIEQPSPEFLVTESQTEQPCSSKSVTQQGYSSNIETVHSDFHIKRGVKRPFPELLVESRKKSKLETERLSVTDKQDDFKMLQTEPKCMMSNKDVKNKSPQKLLHKIKFKIEPVSSKAVKQYLRIIFRKVIPSQILGSARNNRKFLRHCYKLAESCKFQSFRLGTIMRDLKMKDIQWLKSIDSMQFKENLLAKLVLWLIEDFVIVLLRTFFYVTEVSYNRHKLAFYLKRVYHKMFDTEMNKMRKVKKIQELKGSVKLVKTLEQKKNFQGIARMRFLPKKNGCRPLTYIRYNEQVSGLINKIKIFLSQILAQRRSTQKVLQGSMHNILSKYWPYWKKEAGNLHFVRTDIVDAFGSICHSTLLDILKSLIPAGRTFILKKYRCFLLREGYTRVTYSQAFSHMPPVHPRSDSIRDVGQDEIVDGSELLKMLERLIKGQIFTIGKKYYLLRNGIPQGGRLSSVLCEIYYSHMDIKYFSEFGKGMDLLLRAVDDYLFITNNLEQAKRFLDIVKRGIPEYGCNMSIEKTHTNVENSEDIFEYTNKISFYGYIIHLENLQVEGNFSSYANQDVGHSMTLDASKPPGKALEYRMKLISSLKLDPICLNEFHNTRERVLSNVFASSLLQAFRFHAVVAHLFSKKHYNQRYLTKMVRKSASRLARRVRTIVSDNKLESTVDFTMVCWLAYKAFKIKFSKHGNLYKGVLQTIRRLLKSLSSKLKPHILTELETLTGTIPHVFKLMQ